MIDNTKISKFAISVISELQKNKYQAYLVGGCIRDALAGIEPKDFDKDLKSKLDKGEIFSFPFNYYSDFKLEDGIILKGEKDYFALIGRKTMCNWIGEHSDELPEEVEEFEDNDLDFEMM